MKSNPFIQSGGGGVRVAVIDSGIDLAHPLLRGENLLHDWSFSATHVRQGDTCGHGTEVAAIIRQFAPRCILGSFRVLDGNLRTTTEAIATAARHAMDLGYHILNLSLADSAPGCERIHQEWVSEALARGVHIVASSSNENVDRAQYPAFLQGVISVCAQGNASRPEICYRGGAIQFGASGALAELPDVAKIPPAGVMPIEPDDMADDTDEIMEAACSSFAVPRVTAALASILAATGPLTPPQALDRLRLMACSTEPALLIP
ncbi:MAG: S8 family serine peptidase [Candidatus Methylacidiphilales bacterium]|nr:S8 family serine peptidase [Candidatus Methylacidiphilales bacterium]